MAERNSEIIRQWSILRDIEAASDCTIGGLARKYRVCTRTIRRDIEALESAGFPCLGGALPRKDARLRLIADPMLRPARHVGSRPRRHRRREGRLIRAILSSFRAKLELRAHT